jgi:NAD(P)-dependent dehydrogenase (short-subunit alcohol dehydrogenase family)
MTTPQNVLITGTSSGFGRLTAQTLARKGHVVFASMRGVTGKNAGAARELGAWAEQEKVKLHVVELDVTSDASVDAAVRTILDAHKRIDVVVNNAGRSVFGLQETITVDQAKDIFEINVFGVLRVNRAVLPHLRKQGSGLLVHLSSGLGRVVMPALAVYGSTKFAIESIAEGYHIELAPLGIDSVIVEPGAFPTEFTQNGLFGADAARGAGYGPLADLPQKMGAAMAQMFSAPGAQQPQEVADAIAHLVDLPAGKRPLRTVVDRIMLGKGIEAINATCAEVQAQAARATAG